MRNLKRALSLTLASVMLLGMMVVGAGAAAGYDDVTESNNVEAIEVLQAIEVMVGDERGFGPERPVNRAEMAVVMGKLLNLDYNYYSAACPFNDVYDWARGWVGACAANGIVSGRGDGVYDPGATVTAVEAASMLLRALGYFQYQNDYADGFVLSTVRQGSKVGIFDGVGSSADAPMTRDQVAQIVLNALQIGMVEPDGNTTTFLNPDGTVLATTGKVNYVNITSNKPYAAAINDVKATSVGSQNDGYIVDLGEQLYSGELKLHKYDDDIFYRPSRSWDYKGQEIGTYMKKENIRETYTTGVNIRTLYDLLGRNNLNDYDFAYYVDGVEQTAITAATILSRQDKDFGATGNGVLTQVFVDTEKETIDITSIHTWLAQATVDYNANRENVTMNVFTGYTKSPNLDTTETPKTVAKADVADVVDVKKDDFMLVTMSGKDANSNDVSKLEVVSIDDVEIMTNATLTKFSNRSDAPNSDESSQEALFKSVTTGGTEYKNSSRAFYSDEVLELYDNQRLTDKAYNIYLDKYGYAIGVDLYSGGDNYVFISGVKLNESTISSTYADANAIFLDGTMKTISVNVKDTNKSIKSVLDNSTIGGKKYFQEWGTDPYDNALAYATMNRWFTYTVNADGVYTLTPAARMFTTSVTAAKTIKCNNVVLDRTDADTQDTTDGNSAHAVIAMDGAVRAYGNDNSVYIIPELEKVSASGVSNKVITGVDGLYTGVQDVEIAISTHTATQKIGAGTTDATDLYDSVYTVYDKNNYIIASVVLGEARGTSANYAFILSNAKSEELRDGTYYWEFDAVVDGTKTTLTAQSKFKSTMNELRVGHIQELRYTGDYVTSIKNVTVSNTPSEDKIYTDPTTQIDEKVKEVYDVGHVHNFNECKVSDCKLVEATNTSEGRLDWAATGNEIAAPNLYLDGRTLYLGAGNDYGLTFVDVNVPTVVRQRVDGDMKNIQYGSVTEALANLGDADGDDTNGKLGFDGRLVAVLDKTGRAKWIVIISDTPVITKGVDQTGNNCTITIERYLNEGAVKDLYAKNTKTVSTKTLVSGYWTINVDTDAASPAVPSGYHLLGATTKLVEYVKGQKEYTVEFNYVKDAAVPYTVSFDANVGSTGISGTLTTASASETTVGIGVTLPTAAGLTLGDYELKGWATTAEKAAAGTADAGVAGAKFRPSKDCTLYAVWTKKFTVTWDANVGSTGITGSITTATSKESSVGAGVTLSDGTGLTMGDYVLVGWATSAANAAAGTSVGAPGANYKPTSDCTLYAIWAKKFTVTFDKGNGDGTAPAPVKQSAVGGKVTIPDSTGLNAPAANSSWTFKGWNTKNDGTGSFVAAGDYVPDGDITLYAIWGA